MIIDSNLTHEEAIEIVKNGDITPPDEVLKDQQLIDVQYYSFDGKIHRGQIVVNKKLAQDVLDAFELMKELKFPIKRAIPAAHKMFGSDDQKMIAADNASGFNYRYIAKTTKLSNHSFGRAIDINPMQNPYIRSDLYEPKGAVYDTSAPGTLTPNHPIVKFFKERGWDWGGDWTDRKDYMHFEKPDV
jgi:peptidoglycan LD-endopeptidase CwlK